MSDISTIWSPTQCWGDWRLSGADLQGGGDIVTAVIISLFTDRLSNADDLIPDGSGDPRGWVGDLDAIVPIGSRLWLLGRAKLTQKAAATAKTMAVEALQWMLDDNVVAKFDINTEIVQPNRLNMQVIAFRQDGTRIALDFTHAWDT